MKFISWFFFIVSKNYFLDNDFKNDNYNVLFSISTNLIQLKKQKYFIIF